ncbi:hypothetical protein TcWFU_005872 [Taenia crassiceps]
MFPMNTMLAYSLKPSRRQSPRRRFHSHIDPKQTVEIRRVKKKKAERARRARISDKIVKLYGLALSMVGHNVGNSARMEKAEMLNFCHQVLSGLHNLLEENPEARARLHTCHCGGGGGGGGGGAARTASCRNLVSSHIPTFTSTSPSASTLSAPISQSIPCDSGVFQLPASTSTSVVQSSPDANNSGGLTDCSVHLREKRKEIWRPYLHCL